MSESKKTGLPAPEKQVPMNQDTASEWHLYILACADGTLYTGVAKDVEARVAQHNNGKGAKYTRGRLPVNLVYSEKVGAHGDALRRELRVKMMGLRNKRRLINSADR